MGIALKAANPATHIVGVQTPPASSMYESFRAGHVVLAGVGQSSIADGLYGGTDPLGFEWARAVASEIRLVDEGELPTAIQGLYEQHGVVAEPSGAVGVALVLSGALPLRGPAVVVISGGNIDPRPLAAFLAAS